jgi:hypothetical protein
MSSSFQQDSNQLTPGFYRVVIDMSNSTNFPTTDSGNHQDGGCTPNTWDYFSGASLPSTAALALSRARGNLRFKQVVNQLTGLADCQILDIVLTGETDGSTQATALAFTVKYDRDAFIPLTGAKVGTATVGNDAANNPMNTVAKVIANAVASGLYNGTTESMRVYDPVNSQGVQQSVTANAAVSNATLVGVVSVSQISGTTLV